MVRRVGKYEIGKTLGEGTFGKVKMALNTETNEKVAIKILEKEKIQKQNMGNQIKKEISVMKMVRHKNVVNLIEVLASRTKIFIVLELITGGELFDKIVNAGRLSEDEARFYFLQLVEGVKYCHEQGVCHRDLKPENLLLDDKLNLKISDFGLSALYSKDDNGTEGASGGSSGGSGEGSSELLHTTCGTPNYVAPEVLLDKGYDGRISDIWSMGVILFVLLAGYLPFDEPNMSDLFHKIQKADYKFPNWFSSGAKSLIRKILNPDPYSRIKIDEILKDTWLNKVKYQMKDSDVDGDGDKVEAIGSGSGGDAGDGDGDDGSDKKSKITDKMIPIPTTEQVSNAIIDVNETGDSNTLNEVVTLTAFDVVSALGTNTLNRLIIGDNGTPKNIYLIISSNPDTIESKLREISKQMKNSEFEVVNPKAYIYAIIIKTVKPKIHIEIQLYKISEDSYMMEIEKLSGDALEYNKFYNELRRQLCINFKECNLIGSNGKLV